MASNKQDTSSTPEGVELEQLDVDRLDVRGLPGVLARRDARRYVAEVWAAVASGLGGRLFEALRDRRSLAYTVFATAWQRGRAGALVSYIATAPERM